jgi:hypothetical protein
LAWHLKIDADPDPLPDPAYHFDADPDPDFYLMRNRKRIQTSGFLFDADPDVDPVHKNYADPDFNGENVMPVQRI